MAFPAQLILQILDCLFVRGNFFFFLAYFVILLVDFGAGEFLLQRLIGVGVVLELALSLLLLQNCKLPLVHFQAFAKLTRLIAIILLVVLARSGRGGCFQRFRSVR